MPAAANQWNPNDAVALRDFIAKNPKLKPALEAKIPKCEGKTTEERAATGSEAQGWRDCLKAIFEELAHGAFPQGDTTEFIDPSED